MVAEVQSLPSTDGRIIIAREASIGTLPGSPVYFDLPVTTPSDDFGPTFNLISERVVSQRRRLLGSIVSQNVAAGFEADFKITIFERLVEALFLASTQGHGKKGTVFDTGLSVTATGYDLGEDAAAKGFVAGHLVYAENFSTAANNELKVVTGITGQEVEVSGLTIEASPPDTAVLRAVGIQFGSGELDVVKDAGEFPKLVIASGTLDWTNYNLVPGSRIYIDKANGGSGNRFATAANNGHMRVLSVTASELTIDRADGGSDLTTDMSDETGTGLSIRVFFSDRTADAGDTSDATFLKRSHFAERRLGIPNPVGSAGVIQTEDLFGLIFADFAITVNAEDKTTLNTTMLGINSAEHTGESGDLRTTNGATILSIPQSNFFNNSTDVVRSILAVYSETGGDAAPDPLVKFVTNYEIAFSNNAERLPAVGRSSGFDINVNGMTADINLTNYFTEIASKTTIRNNVRAQFEIAWQRLFNGRTVSVMFDFPAGSLGDGKVQQQIDQSLQQPITFAAAESAEHNQTASANLFWYIP